MAECRDLVLITFPDGSTRQGVVQATYDGGGLLIFHPVHGYMHYGIWFNDLGNATLTVIPDSSADFRADLYRPQKMA